MKAEMSDATRVAVVRTIRAFLPEAQIYVFGSRIRGDAKKYSDLDVAIEMKGKLIDLRALAAIRENFSESNIPFKIDVMDLNAVDDQFKSMVLKNSERW